ncbi:MAG: ABC transporter permease [Phycisphaeraceae bacterium]|nr:MAG: ABC transporter permease [Phycisphaeraceae bacterium]
MSIAGRPGESPRPGATRRALDTLGAGAVDALAHLGSIVHLAFVVAGWIARSFVNRKVRIGRSAIISQIVRIGVRSVGIVSLVSACVGLILAFQLAPPLDEFGRRDLVANVIGVAVTRELGPLIGAIVLTGFAGASIAAEIGTMVVSEEIEALEAHALNPVRFLVVPRVIASTLSMTVLGVLSTFTALAAAAAMANYGLDVPWAQYKQNTLDQVKLVDFLTGVGKSTVFGLLIGLIACANGLKVTGGAAGVGRATTATVVQCVVAIVIADLVFTAIFYALRLF